MYIYMQPFPPLFNYVTTTHLDINPRQYITHNVLISTHTYMYTYAIFSALIQLSNNDTFTYMPLLIHYIYTLS